MPTINILSNTATSPIIKPQCKYNEPKKRNGKAVGHVTENTKGIKL